MKNLTRFKKNTDLVIKNPRIIPRLIKNYTLLSLKKQPLRTVEIALTYNCQCNCIHCSCANLRNNKKEDITTEQTKKLIEDSIKLGAIHILFTGGETLLAKNLIELVSYAKSKKCITSLDTNGILLNNIDLIRKLKKAGLDLAVISLDCLNKEHDKIRRFNGLYEKVMKSIRNCKKENLNFMISTLVIKNKIKTKYIEEVLGLAKKLSVDVILCLPIPIGNWKNKDISLGKKELGYIKKTIKHPNCRLCQDNNYLIKGCAAGSEKIAVNCYGEVMPCSFIQLSYGNIKQLPLKKIIKRMRKIAYFKKINKNVWCLPATNNGFKYWYKKNVK